MVPSRKNVIGLDVIQTPGRAIQFMHNEFDTEDQEEIDFLRKHFEFGTIINEAPSAEETKSNILKMAEELKASAEPVVEAIPEGSGKPDIFQCETCGFVAKSKLGLASHTKTHA